MLELFVRRVCSLPSASPPPAYTFWNWVRATSVPSSVTIS